MENSNNTKPVPEAEPKNNSETQEQGQGETPNLSSLTGGGGGCGGVADEALPPPLQQQSSRRTPFTNLSQVDADLALARALQEQERAYMMLRMGNDGSEYGSWDAGSYLHDEEDEEDEDDDDFGDPDHLDHDHGDGEDEDDTDVDDRNDVDAFDAHAHDEAGIDEDEDDDDDEDVYDEEDDDEDDNPGVEFDPALFSSDEAYARALQDAEEREMAARLFALAGLHDREYIDQDPVAGEAEDMDEHGGNSQDTWEEVDPDELSYEELLALGEVVGTESRGLSADKIALLPSIKYKAGSTQSGSNDSCVICRLDYEDDEALTLLSCKHSYHSECINNWLKINKVCPVCSAEVSTSGHG